MVELDESWLATLDSLGDHAPRDYFHGVRADNLCWPDNIICFLRRSRSDLNQRNFESRPHHRHVLIVVLETPGSVSVDGAVFHLHPGDAFLIAPFQFHFYLQVEQRALAWLFLTFEAPNPAAFSVLVNTPVALDPAEKERALAIAKSYLAAESGNAFASNMLILDTARFLLELRETATARAGEPLPSRVLNKAGAEYTLLQRVNRLLYDRLAEGIGIQELAQRLALSESHLRKRFRSLSGVSLGSYLVHYKLNRAVKLLTHSSASLSQIAVECGYESLAAFSRSFKTKLGTSPSAYRKGSAFGLAEPSRDSVS